MPIRIVLVVVIAIFCALAISSASSQTLRDGFASCPAGSDGGPAWEPRSATWEIVDASYIGDAGISIWKSVPFAAEMSFSCDVTVLELQKGDWLTVGIGFAGDEKDYWALNLVVAPETQGRKHSTELQESVDGFWPAAAQAGTRLNPLPGKGGDFSWQTNHTYRFEIHLSKTTLIGRIFDGTNEVTQLGYEMTPSVKAVRAGWPILRVNGMRARFDQAVARVTQTAPPPVIVAAKAPAWVSRPGHAIVAGSGFFRTAEADGRWWLVDPEGKPFFAVGTDHVNYNVHFCEQLGYAPYHRNVEAKFGSEEAWAKSAVERLKAWGFNELPAGHSPSLRHRGLPHILFGSFGTVFARREWICEPTDWTGFPDVFSPRWESFCRFTARETVRDSLRDPWCIGTFIDNELEWFGKHGQLVDEIFRRGQSTPAKRALWRWLLQQYGAVTVLNQQLSTDYVSEADFLAATNVPKPSAAFNRTQDEFLELIADRYFGIAANALREADPDHLVLGCRFAGRVPSAVLAAAGKYNDVFTFNTYPRVDFESAWSSDGTGGVVERLPRELSGYFAVARKPILITEWGFPALDSGLPCKHGAGMRVDTQEQKAACYRIFVNCMADLPFLIGYHYFMWADEPAAGISATFPEDSNYGLVNEKDETYEVLAKAASEANRAVESRHAHSSWSGDLQLRTGTDSVEVLNTNLIPSHGLVRVSAHGQSHVEEISLAPAQSMHLSLPGSVACVELQNWDGAKQRAIGGHPLGPLEVANGSAATLAGAPVLLAGQPPIAAWLRPLAPGETEKLSTPNTAWTNPSHLDLQSKGVLWSGNCKDGNLFDHIQAGDLDLGRLVLAVHQQIDGQNLWTECDHAESLRMQEQPDAWLIEAVMGFGATDGLHSFRAAVRLAVYKPDGIVLARPLWVENNGKRSWQMVEIFWFCRPAAGVRDQDVVAGHADVPEYYCDAQYWTDGKRGGCFGAVDRTGGWRVNFWKGSASDFHPDARFPLEQELSPGKRITADAVPYLWIFANRDVAHWRTVARLGQQTANSILVGTGGD